MLLCKRAYTNFEVFTNGDLWICNPNSTIAPVGNIFVDDPLEVWRGPKVRAIREGIARGDFACCNRDFCGFIGMPQSAPLAPNGPIIEVPDGPIEPPPRIRNFFISYDKTCNLSCHQCRKLVFRPYPGYYEGVWKISQRILDSGILSEVDRIRFMSAGEVFSSPMAKKFIAEIPWDKYPLLKLHFQTNGVLFTPANYEAFSETARKRLNSVTVSVDAATEKTYILNRANRNRGQWQTLHENLKFISSLKASGAIQHFYLSLVVQDNNFEEMPDFCRMAISYGAKVEFLMVICKNSMQEEYLGRAIHLPTHPRHQQFLEVRKDPILSMAEWIP